MPTDVRTILSLSVPVIVEIGRREMSLEDVLSLGPGSIVELAKSSDDALTLLVNNIDVGEGHAVKVGENFGIRVGVIGTPEERIQAMAGAGSDFGFEG